MATTPIPNKFWSDFLKKASALRQLILCDKIEVAYRRLVKIMSDSEIPFVIELTCDEDNAVLIFSPESDKATAKLIDSFVTEAPKVDKWIILTRRQRKPIEDAICIIKEIYEIDEFDAKFNIFKNKSKYDVEMCTDMQAEFSVKQLTGLLDMFMEHSLGEDFVMKYIERRMINDKSTSGKFDPYQFISFFFPMQKS